MFHLKLWLGKISIVSLTAGLERKKKNFLMINALLFTPTHRITCASSQIRVGIVRFFFPPFNVHKLIYVYMIDWREIAIRLFLLVDRRPFPLPCDCVWPWVKCRCGKVEFISWFRCDIVSGNVISYPEAIRMFLRPNSRRNSPSQEADNEVLTS